MKVQVLTLRKIVNHFEPFTDSCHRLTSCCIQTLGNFCFALHMTGKVRRFFLVHFGKSYVQRQLVKREGYCRQCGVCCNLLFTCPMLTKNGRCLIYSISRPGACRIFPIDQRDIDEVKLCGRECGYAFPKKGLP